jgi:hypothetical protein
VPAGFHDVLLGDRDALTQTPDLLLSEHSEEIRHEVVDLAFTDTVDGYP